MMGKAKIVTITGATGFLISFLISLLGDKKGKVSDINIHGAANVAKVVAHCGVSRLIHVSSIHVVAHDHHTPHVDESLSHDVTSSLAYNRTISKLVQFATKAKGKQKKLPQISLGALYFVMNQRGLCL